MPDFLQGQRDGLARADHEAAKLTLHAAPQWEDTPAPFTFPEGWTYPNAYEDIPPMSLFCLTRARREHDKRVAQITAAQRATVSDVTRAQAWRNAEDDPLGIRLWEERMGRTL